MAQRTQKSSHKKYIFVVGGVISGLGKGTAASSLGLILQAKGYNVTAVKIDPYVNVDAGTMNPTEHGEVFVTADGKETDQDLGNYERFLNTDLSQYNYMTTGAVYQSVIERERNLEYGGKCVDVVPYVPLEVIRRIKLAAQKNKADITIIEVGGTTGDYQNMIFLEAARMMRLENPEDVLCVLVSYFPVPSKLGEMKTKPTQHAVSALSAVGLQPDFILCRASSPLDTVRKRKVSIYCNVRLDQVISAPDVDFVYDIPLQFERDQLAVKLLNALQLPAKGNDLSAWKAMVRRAKNAKKVVRIAIVGKYFGIGDYNLGDSYISVIQALMHGAIAAGVKPDITWIDAEDFEKNPASTKKLAEFDGVVVPGGFGKRGTEGKIKAIKYVRENNVPFLGLCLGMQLAVVEFARNAAGMRNANSTELDPKTKYPVIDILPEQKTNLAAKHFGGSMRLGNHTCRIVQKTTTAKQYGTRTIQERHRHRYEVNNKLRKTLESKGLVVAGVNPEKDLVEIIELPKHRYFVGVQFHPELRSRPLAPHPLFAGFMKAAAKKK